MARISFSALVEEIVGKLAGSVFQDSYGGYQVRTRVTPKNPQSQYQQLRRGAFGYLSAGWRFLTAPQRQSFIDAALTPPAALNLFLQANINLTLIEVPTITDYVPSADPGTMQIEFDTADPTVMLIKATGATTIVPAGTKLLLQVTYQKAPTKIFTNPSQYSPVISFDEGTDLSIPTDILSAWQVRYGQITVGKRLCLSSAVIDKSNGRRGSTLINCTIIDDMAKFVKIHTNVTQVSTSGTALLTADTFSLPANTLVQNGDCITCWYAIRLSGAAINNELTWLFGGGGILFQNLVAPNTVEFRVTAMRTDSDTLVYTSTVLLNGVIVNQSTGSLNGNNFAAANNIVMKMQAPTSGALTFDAGFINKELI